MYWGDGERFAVTREQVLQIERRHVILRLALSGVGERQVRLHVEGLSTLGHKRRVMDRLAQQLETWHAHLAPTIA